MLSKNNKKNKQKKNKQNKNKGIDNLFSCLSLLQIWECVFQLHHASISSMEKSRRFQVEN